MLCEITFTMDRPILEDLTLLQLQEKLTQNGFPSLETRARCIEALLIHYENCASSNLISLGDIPGTSTSLILDAQRQTPFNANSSSNPGQSLSSPEIFYQLLVGLMEHMKQQPLLLAQLVNLNINDHSSMQSAIIQPTIHTHIISLSGSSGSDGGLPFAGISDYIISIANPSFSWIQNVGTIARSM